MATKRKNPRTDPFAAAKSFMRHRDRREVWLQVEKIVPANEQRTATTQALRALRQRSPGAVWLESLLQEALDAASRAAQPELARVLLALAWMVRDNDLAALSAADRKGTLVGIANGYVSDRSGDHVVGARRQEFARAIAECFLDEEEGNRGLPFFCDLLADALHSHMRNAFGPPQDGWCEKIMQQVKEVRDRTDGKHRKRERRAPIHYVRAILRGWGLTAAAAKDATSELAKADKYI